jgi:G3E family GTPase
MITLRRRTYRWINIGFGQIGQMVAQASSKMLVYFNGCVCCTKISSYQTFGTISSMGRGKGSMMEHVHASKEHYT